MKLVFETENLEVYESCIKRDGKGEDLHIYIAIVRDDWNGVAAHATVKHHAGTWWELECIEPTKVHPGYSGRHCPRDYEWLLPEFANGLETHVGSRLCFLVHDGDSEEFLALWRGESRIDSNNEWEDNHDRTIFGDACRPHRKDTID